MSVKNVERTFKNSDYFLHSHKNNCEILYITTGIGKVKAYDEVIQVVPGDIIFCPRNF